MKRILSLLLVILLLVSVIPCAFALETCPDCEEVVCKDCGACPDMCNLVDSCGGAECVGCPSCGHCICAFLELPDNTTYYGQGTLVKYDADDKNGDGQLDNLEYTITVPALLNPVLGQQVSGTVTLKGMWPSSSTITVTADDTVTLVNDINSENAKDLAVTFAPMVCAGNNTEEKTYTEQVFLAAMPADALFGTWSGVFNYNVVYDDGIERIDFSIDGVNYKAVKGMTWEEWVNSPYNTDSWQIQGVSVSKNGMSVAENIDGDIVDYVSFDDNILANFAYKTSNLE